jgi:hypothetical protein
MPLTPEQRSEQARKASAARKTAGNRYTTGARSEMPIKEKDALRAEFAAKKLEAFMRDPQKHPMEPTEVTAAKILLDKGKPSLQAVEQTNIEPALARTEAEIIESLSKIIEANPDILTQLIALRARSEASKPAPVGQSVSSEQQNAVIPVNQAVA